MAAGEKGASPRIGARVSANQLSTDAAAASRAAATASAQHKPVRVGSSRVSPGRYKVTVSEKISPAEANAIKEYITSLPHVSGVSVSGKFVTVLVDKDKHWRDIRQKVEVGVHNVVEPGVPHSAAELKERISELRTKMLPSDDGTESLDRPTGLSLKYPGLSLLAAKSLSKGVSGNRPNASDLVANSSTQRDTTSTALLAFLQEACLEVLTTAINPVLERDGGSCSLDRIAPAPEGKGYVVFLHMKGACKGCPASTITMKAFIQKTICEYLPEVVSVEESGSDGEQDGEQDGEAVEAVEAAPSGSA